MATTTVSWSRRRSAPAHGSASGSPSTRLGFTPRRSLLSMPDKPSSFRDTAVAPAQMSPGLSALLVDDEAPALSELTFLLRQDHRIGEIRTASSGADALRALEAHPVDVVFCDIKMPGLDGMELSLIHISEPTRRTPTSYAVF